MHESHILPRQQNLRSKKRIAYDDIISSQKMVVGTSNNNNRVNRHCSHQSHTDRSTVTKSIQRKQGELKKRIERHLQNIGAIKSLIESRSELYSLTHSLKHLKI